MRHLTEREEATMRVINSNPHGTMDHLAHNATSAIPEPRPLAHPNQNDAPQGWHVQVLADGGSAGCASPASTWHTFKRLYGYGYKWRAATPAEIKEAKPLFAPIA